MGIYLGPYAVPRPKLGLLLSFCFDNVHSSLLLPKVNLVMLGPSLLWCSVPRPWHCIVSFNNKAPNASHIIHLAFNGSSRLLGKLDDKESS